jgi:hypothetical protein
MFAQNESLKIQGIGKLSKLPQRHINKSQAELVSVALIVSLSNHEGARHQQRGHF